MPSAEELAALGPGSGVKVIFRLADLTDSVRDRVLAHGLDEPPRLCTVTERMWLVVVRRNGDLLTCVLDNQPYAAYSRLVVGAEVTVPVAYVIATGTGPDDLAGYLAQNDENGLPRLPESETTRPEDPRRMAVDPGRPVRGVPPGRGVARPGVDVRLDARGPRPVARARTRRGSPLPRRAGPG